jgi:hypothetical protein
MLSYETRINESWLTNCSAEAACQWIRDTWSSPATGELDIVRWDDRREALEKLLLFRNDPLVNLALARYGYSQNIHVKLFAGGDCGVRCAILANSDLNPDSLDIASVVRGGNRDELEALARNPYFKDSFFYEALLKREKVFSELSEENYQFILTCFGENSRISTPYDDTKLDGWSDYAYHTVFFKAWELTGSVPATEEWAGVLNYLLGKAQPYPGGRLDNLDAILERWRLAPSTMGQPMSSSAFWLRARIGDQIDANQDLLGSDDLALRFSFYRRFDPQTFTEWPRFVDKDGEAFALAMLDNNKLWQSDKERRRLEEVAWSYDGSKGDGNMWMASMYRSRREHMETQHPEWFETSVADAETLIVVRQLKESVTSLSSAGGYLPAVVERLADLTARQRRVEKWLVVVVLALLGLLWHLL